MIKDIKVLIRRLNKAYGNVKIALRYSTPFELLTATILSAQCTDERVNIVTKELFKKYRSVSDFAKADIDELQKYVHSTGFFRSKAGNIKKSARIVQEKFNGRIPDTMEDILTLPGVARKTANIVLGNIYGVIEGIAVDTHVIRISNLLGLTKNVNPQKIEKDLMQIVPRKDWLRFSYLVQAHGRKICIARRPKCGECFLNDICPSAKIELTSKR